MELLNVVASCGADWVLAKAEFPCFNECLGFHRSEESRGVDGFAVMAHRIWFFGKLSFKRGGWRVRPGSSRR
jgi:hypothetical protein